MSLKKGLGTVLVIITIAKQSRQYQGSLTAQTTMCVLHVMQNYSS